MAFTCPRCERTSHHPEDERQGWCGACQDFTGRGDIYECCQCGTRSVVPPLHAGSVWCPCGSPEPMHELSPRSVSPAAFAELAENPEAPWECGSGGRFRLSDVQVVTDPSVPAGHVMAADSHGLWQFIGAAGSELRHSDGAAGPDFAAVARYISERYGQALSGVSRAYGFLAGVTLEASGRVDEAMADLITGSQRNPVTDSGDCPRPAPEADDCHWFDSMEWHPGDVEW